MLIKPSLEKLLPKVDNRYTLAIMIAKRARQLVDGAQPLIDSDSPNLVTLACEELSYNRITWVKGQITPYIPLRPEVEAARLAARTAAAHASMADAVKDALEIAASLSDTDDLDETDADIISDAILTLDDEAEETGETNETPGGESDSGDAEAEDELADEPAEESTDEPAEDET